MEPQTWRLPGTAAVLGVLGMVAYPVCVVGIAASIGLGSPFRVVLAWAVALVLSAAAGLPKLTRDLDARHDARNAREDWRPMVSGSAPAPQFSPPAGSSSVRSPYED